MRLKKDNEFEKGTGVPASSTDQLLGPRTAAPRPPSAPLPPGAPPNEKCLLQRPRTGGPASCPSLWAVLRPATLPIVPPAPPLRHWLSWEPAAVQGDEWAPHSGRRDFRQKRSLEQLAVVSGCGLRATALPRPTPWPRLPDSPVGWAGSAHRSHSSSQGGAWRAESLTAVCRGRRERGPVD